MIDINWWHGDTTHQPHPPVGHAKFWPKGMLAACEYAHQHGMRFGLYWNCNPSMTTAEGIQHRKDDVKQLHDKFHIDFYRTDSTAGHVLQTGGFGPAAGHTMRKIVGYWQTKGFYEVIDWLLANVPNFYYENCSGGGSIKDYGVMRRAIRIQNQDRYYPIDARRAFYDASYALHPMQISTLSGSWAEWQASGSVYEFRSASLGAPYWHPDAPNGGNGGPVWTASQKAGDQAGGEHVQDEDPAAGPERPTCTTSSRVRTTRSGTASSTSIRPPRKARSMSSGRAARRTTQTVKLKGLDAKARYWLWCEDGSIAPLQKDRRRTHDAGLRDAVATQVRATLCSSRTLRSARPQTCDAFLPAPCPCHVSTGPVRVGNAIKSGVTT